MPAKREKPLPPRRDAMIDKTIRELAQIGHRRVMLIIDPHEKHDDEFDTVKLVIKPALSMWELVAFTEEELDIFKTMIVTAIETARPAVQELDRRAAAAVETGDLRYRRQYRTRPIHQKFED